MLGRFAGTCLSAGSLFPRGGALTLALHGSKLATEFLSIPQPLLAVGSRTGEGGQRLSREVWSEDSRLKP